MKTVLTLSVLGAALCALLAGCGSGTAIINTGDTSKSRVRSMDGVSSVDYVEAVDAGVDSLLTSSVYTTYLAKYRRDKGDTYAQPLMAVGKIKNNTSSHIDAGLLTNRMSEAILNSGLAQVSTAAGENRDDANAGVRDLEYDENFNQDTVMQRGTLDSPDLSLSGEMISKKNVDGRDSELTIMFVMTLTDLRNGRMVWTKTFEVGRQATRSIFGS